MAVNNLYLYVDILKSKDIKGSDLKYLDRDKLITMGIQNEFHQNMILSAISDLFSENKCINQGSYPDLEKSTIESSNEHSSNDNTSNTNNTNHKFIDISFYAMQECDRCKKNIHGFQHQGQMCEICFLIFHRRCTVHEFSTCSSYTNSRLIKDRRNFKINHFGAKLCIQFLPLEYPAPFIVMQCTKELEHQSKYHLNHDLYRIYRSSTNSNEVITLRDKFNTDFQSIDFSKVSLQSIGEVLKMYLGELPDPVIPVEAYDEFIETSSKYMVVMINLLML